MATAKRQRTSDPKLGPTIFVLFGATGDLAKRMVLPAFYRLALEGLLPKQWRLLGNGRGDVAHEDFRAHVHDALTEFGPKPEPAAWDAFAQRLFFAGGGFNSDSPGSLLDDLAEARKSLGGDPQLVHYLAIPPVAFSETTKALGVHGLAKGARVVYEKPFGTSPQSFRALNRVVHSVLDEQQVYRIDHFLGKEATQDLHLLRFANRLFAAMLEPRAHRVRPDRRAGKARHYRPGLVLRRHRRGARHARHPPVPGGGGGRDGTAGQPRRPRPAGHA